MVIEARPPLPPRSYSCQYASPQLGLPHVRQHWWLRAGMQVFRSPLLYLLSSLGAGCLLIASVCSSVKWA